MNSHRETSLLWTGGWDSTYRLLELLLVHGGTVQPYYLIDTHRRSLRLELRTMRRIKSLLFEQHREAWELLRSRPALLPASATMQGSATDRLTSRVGMKQRMTSSTSRLMTFFLWSSV